jgi:energy-coupling factor transporter ATP-binding protein EcfA2
MLTRLLVRRFKLFEQIDIELGQRVLFVGPNNSGKTSALQALALWEQGVKRWVERRGLQAPEKRSGVALNRKDLTSVPVAVAKSLWRDLRTRAAKQNGTMNLLIEILVEGEDASGKWACGMEFDYANEESFYCRPMRDSAGNRMPIPEQARQTRVAYLPPMSGLAPSELRLEPGAVQARIGEGRTAEVLRNLCHQVYEERRERWQTISDTMRRLFLIELEPPLYLQERGELELYYRTPQKTRLEISLSGRGQQQVLLLLAYMEANPGAVLLIDEPDAHLEILRQREIYNLLADFSEKTHSQIICASHSEVLLNEAADRDLVIAFLGRPHRIDDRGQQLLKSLRDIPFVDYYQAEQTGWVLYLEGATDLAILRAFAKKLAHPVAQHLERAFVKYVGNQPVEAQKHFHGLREAVPHLRGFALFDRLERELPQNTRLQMRQWRRREIENYLCTPETLLAFAAAEARLETGSDAETTDRFTQQRIEELCALMQQCIAEVSDALATLGKPEPFSPDLKASEEFLTPLFTMFYNRLGKSNRLQKSDFHQLAAHAPESAIDPEVREVLDAIEAVADSAQSA